MTGQFNKIAKDTKKHYVATNNIMQVIAYTTAFAETLENHYQRVAKIFAKRINTADIKLTTDELIDLENKIARDAKLNADQSTAQILTTIQKDINESFEKARVDALQKQEVLTNRQLAANATAKFRRKAMSRAKRTIPITETQEAAEKTKLTVFNAHHHSRNKPADKNAIKTWHTVGDERVRHAHRAANLQTQQLSNPYIVMGERLMQPGDSSLGASPENTINCRCSSQYSFN